MFWHKVLKSWQNYRGKEADKEKADNEFIKVMNVQNEGLHLSRRTLYRKWNSYIMEGEASLADGRGKHGNHNYKMTREIFDVFEYYYLNENKPSIKQCMRETALYFEGQEIELPCYTTFKRSAEKIPKAIKLYFREREKVFIDKCAPYIKRMYEDLESNDIWVADNHTFDIMVEKEGKPVRVYLTAFMDVRSRKMMGWCVTDAPSSDATIYALKKGCEKFGVPRSIYTDNGREFLFHDLGENGFRKKRKNGEKLKLPSILDDLGIEFRTALPRNARGKGIERAFYTVKEQFSKLFESYTGGTILERPDRLKKVVKSRKGLPNIEELIQYVDIYIEGWYNKQTHEGAGMKGKCPDEIFTENLITQRILPKEKVARKIYGEAIAKLKGSNKVIIIDEAQHLTVRVINHLRCMSDESGIGIAFVGNEEIYLKMRGSGQASYAQLYSRIAYNEHIMTNSITKEDIALLFEESELEEKALDILFEISKTNYGIRGVVNVFVNTAAIFGKTDGRSIARVAKDMNIKK